MYQKYILFFLIFSFHINHNWQNQNNLSIPYNKTNIYGKLNGRNYEHILFNNSTEIRLYEKPLFDEGDPHIFQHTKSLIPTNDPLGIYITKIKYIEQTHLEKLPKKLPTSLTYHKQQWYEVEVTFSNNEVKNYLLPATNTITMTDSTLGLHSSIKISGLINDGLVIEGIKKEKIKDKEDDISNKDVILALQSTKK